MSLPTFGQLLAEYMSRSGISDSELARNIGVRRQTIFRWKEGLVERPRSREDVLQCAKKLRLTDDERDRLLLAAGFPPEHLSATVLQPPPIAPALPPTEEAPPQPAPAPELEAAADAASDQPDAVEEIAVRMVPSALLVNALDGSAPVADPPLDPPLTPGSSPLTPLSKPVDEPVVEAAEDLSLPATPTQSSASPLPPLLAGMQRWLLTAGVLLLALLAFLWVRNAPLVPVPTPTPPLTPVITLYPPPQTTPTQILSTQLAAEGETLLLIAQFKDYIRDDTYYNVAGRIGEELTTQLTAAGLVSTTVMTWPQEITDTRSARDLLAAANATMVIWGEYDSGRVRVNLEVDDAKLSQRQNFTLASSGELSVTVNDIVPKALRDTALFVLGNQATYRGKYEIAIARQLSKLGNVQAAALFQQALTREPTDAMTTAKLNFYLGYVTAKGETLNDYERAIGYYTNALSLNRDYNALYNRGTIQIKRAQKAPANETFIVESLNNAIADLTAFIKLRPQDPNGYFNRGVAYYERDEAGDMAAAIVDFDQVIALDHNNIQAYFHRGLAHIRAGQGEQWVADFAKMQLLNEKDHSPIMGLCWGYVMAQQPDKALFYCDQAVQHDASGFSNDSRGIAYALLGRYDEAIVDFRAYLTALKAHDSASFFERNRGPLVEQWITQLEAGQNPFDEALLEKLRHRDHY